MKKFKKSIITFALLVGVLSTLTVSPFLPNKKRPTKPFKPPVKTKAIPGALPIIINY